MMLKKAECFVLVVFPLFFTTAVQFTPPKYSACHSKDFGYGGTVCVCSDELGCDSFSDGSSPLSEDEYAVYTSSKAGDRFSLRIEKILKVRQASDRRKSRFAEAEHSFTVNQNEGFQTILGIGGAFTDAAGINILSISSTLQQKLLSSYFSQDGIEYSIGRIPMASCDFSTCPYSYDDHEGDFEMGNFSLTKEDLQLKIPIMMTAMKMSKRNLTFFGSPWASPAWMKTNGKMQGAGQLKGVAGDKYHKAWALYFAKFIKAYEDNGVKIWGLTVQNEPSDGFIKGFNFQCMAYTAEMERDFIKEDLGPTLAKFGYSNVKLMIVDDLRNFVKSWADTILGDPETAKYLSGIAVHFYNEDATNPDVLTEVHKKFPNHFILMTEACCGSPPPKGVHLGQWTRGNKYSHSIIENLSHWSIGWVDWNIALNMQGGPNWVKNLVDSPIIVDAENGVFYKQPMFYHLGHFSKFVPPGSQRILIEVTSSKETCTLEFIGFVTPQMNTVMVVLNTGARNITFEIIDQKKGIITETIPSYAIQTYIW